MDDAIPESKRDGAYYESLARKHKSNNEWKAAGDAFVQAANMYEQKGNKYYAHLGYHNAVECFLNIDPRMAIEALKKAKLLDDDQDNDTMFAQIYKRYLNDLDKASEHYELASFYQERRGESHWSEKALNKAARCAATGGNFERAAKMFEKVGGFVADFHLLSSSYICSNNPSRRPSGSPCYFVLFKQHRSKC
ncbi:unnamed protein product [Dibothriocephalus latus]|uniref:Uncharacterized protein n=1 Tax=Dibothriocephalus latus TaxID=60516 RepID=A0A3P7P9D6_DIBLA|nr:unnamed protein product [Dibothriocephalus latus]